MSKKDLVIKYMNNNHGYIKTSDFLKLGISKPMIKKYLDEDIVERVDHGIYMNKNILVDPCYLLQMKYPNVIFSYNTAFHILNLTNKTPDILDITVRNGKKVRGDYNIHYVAERYYDIGVIEVISPHGNPIYIYNAERCLCDMLKHEGEIELELQNRIIDYYFKSDNKNIDLLLDYAKIFKIYDKVNTIINLMMKW